VINEDGKHQKARPHTVATCYLFINWDILFFRMEGISIKNRPAL